MSDEQQAGAPDEEVYILGGQIPDYMVIYRPQLTLSEAYEAAERGAYDG